MQMVINENTVTLDSRKFCYQILILQEGVKINKCKKWIKSLPTLKNQIPTTENSVNFYTIQ